MAGESGTEVTDSSQLEEDFEDLFEEGDELQPEEACEQDDSWRYSTDGKERVITIPNPTHPERSIEIKSSTMSPKLLRELRDDLEKLTRVRNGAL